MNKERIVGLILLALGFILFLLFDGDLTEIVAGVFSGIGIALLLTGRIRSSK